MRIVSDQSDVINRLMASFNQNKAYIRVYEQQPHILPIPDMVRSRHRQDIVGGHPIAANLVIEGVRPSGCFMVAWKRLVIPQTRVK